MRFTSLLLLVAVAVAGGWLVARAVFAPSGDAASSATSAPQIQVRPPRTIAGALKACSTFSDLRDRVVANKATSGEIRAAAISMAGDAANATDATLAATTAALVEVMNADAAKKGLIGPRLQAVEDACVKITQATTP